MKTRNEIRFLLNDEPISLGDVRCKQSLLDFLRVNRRLTGTKEGCAEGDCGACTVLVGTRRKGKLRYQSVNACIRFLGSLDGCHVVTVEHLNKDEILHPIQQAMIEHHGSQCGFCTPGIVMSLYGLFLETPQPNVDEIEKALQGNLCRCTGYQPIINAAVSVANPGIETPDPLKTERARITRELKALDDGITIDIQTEKSGLYVPANLADFARLFAKHPNATIVAGATDVGLWVTKHFTDISPAIFIHRVSELAEIATSKDGITIGAMVSYSDAQAKLIKMFPALAQLWHRIGGEQVRNMGTIGGNIANGSPIGDTPPPFIALDAKLTLRKGNKSRTIPLEKYFLEYGKQDLRSGEFVESVFIPKPVKNQKIACYKVSKRREEDITAVCGAFCITLDKTYKVSEARIVYGGMAGTPARAKNVEKFLVGKVLDRETVEQAGAFFDKDYKPLSDWRASSQYRQIVAHNLLKRFMIECRGHDIQINDGAGNLARQAV